MSSAYEQKSGGNPSSPPPAYGQNYSGSYGVDNPGFPSAPPQGQYNTQYVGQYGQTTTVVTQPVVGYVSGNQAMAEEYQKYMIASIVVTFLCCWPVGICAIQRSREAKNAAFLGNRAEADRHADAAKRMIIGSILGGLVCIGIIVAIVVVRINQINNCYDNYGYYC